MPEDHQVYLAAFRCAFELSPPRPATPPLTRRPRPARRPDPRLTHALLATCGPTWRTSLTVLVVLGAALLTIFALR